MPEMLAHFAAKQQDRELPEMSVARCWCAAASFDDILYVVGGEGADDSILASAECFDPSIGQGVHSAAGHERRETLLPARCVTWWIP
jgi:hypothetical protein